MKPITRKEIFENAIARGEKAPIKPMTRKEIIMAKEAEREASGGSGGGGEYFETVTGGRLYWDGNTDGLPSVTIDLGEEMGGEVAYYKVSDVLPPASGLLTDSSIVVTAINDRDIQSINLSQMGMVITSVPNTFFYVGVAVNNTTNEIMGTIFPEQGIWLTPTMMGGRLILEFGSSHCDFESKQLKPEHLPNNDFIVTLTLNEDMTMTTDRLFGEIDTAILAGKNIIVKAYMLDGSHKVFRDYAYYPEIQLKVSYFEPMSDNVVSFYRLSINSNNTVDYESTTL